LPTTKDAEQAKPRRHLLTEWRRRVKRSLRGYRRVRSEHVLLSGSVLWVRTLAYLFIVAHDLVEQITDTPLLPFPEVYNVWVTVPILLFGAFVFIPVQWLRNRGHELAWADKALPFVDIAIVVVLVHCYGGHDFWLYGMWMALVFFYAGAILTAPVNLLLLVYTLVLWWGLFALESEGVLPYTKLIDPAASAGMGAYLSAFFISAGFLSQILSRSLAARRQTWVQAMVASLMGQEMNQPLDRINLVAEEVRHGDIAGPAAAHQIQRETLLIAGTLREVMEFCASAGNPGEETFLTVNDFLQNAVGEASTAAGESGVTAELESAFLLRESVMVQGRRQLLVAAFRSILRNCFESAGIEVHGRILVDTGVSDDDVEILIRHNGGGQAAERLCMIWDVYDRGRGADDTTGLDLFLARLIIEGHGGTARAQSEPRQGTSIAVSLPRFDHRGFMPS
jgi:two-component system, OmpR family, sensor kinase